MHMGPREWATIQATGARVRGWLLVIRSALVVVVSAALGAWAVWP